MVSVSELHCIRWIQKNFVWITTTSSIVVDRHNRNKANIARKRKKERKSKPIWFERLNLNSNYDLILHNIAMLFAWMKNTIFLLGNFTFHSDLYYVYMIQCRLWKCYVAKYRDISITGFEKHRLREIPNETDPARLRSAFLILLCHC